MKKITIMSQDSFTLNVKVPGTNDFLSSRLHEHQTSILKFEIHGVTLGSHPLFHGLRSRRKMTGAAILDSSLSRQRELCLEILKYLDRLPETDLFLKIESCLRPSKLIGIPYNGDKYGDDLKSICETFSNRLPIMNYLSLRY